MARRTKAAPEPEPEVDEDEDIEELGEDEEETEPVKASANEIVFGVADLCKHINKTLKPKKPITPRDMRVLIRKMAHEGRVNREVLPGNRSRYDWPDGTDDPEVKRIIKAVKAGELEAGKREALEKLKANKAAKVAAEGKVAKKTTAKKKAAPIVEEVDDDEEFEDDEDE